MNVKFEAWIILIIMGSAFVANADATPLDNGRDTCPTPRYLSQICTLVGNKTTEREESPNMYLYQTAIYKAACIRNDDSEDVARAKVQRLWKEFPDALSCDLANFNVSRGSLLKFAIARQSNDFLHDATEVWKIDLNHVDASDNRTVLDYIFDEMRKAKGTSLEGVLRNYYNNFRKAGAKHRSELERDGR